MSDLSTTDINAIAHRLRHHIYQDDKAGHDARRADVEQLSHALGLAQDTIDHLTTALAHEVNGPTAMGEPVLPHPDDVAVDRFAAAMKSKLAVARGKGRGGWQDKTDCTQQHLSDGLRAHVAKGDPRDVANFAMFLHQRGESILPPTTPDPRSSMQFTLGQAETLLAFFGGSNADMTVEYFPPGHWPDAPDAPAGLYVYCTDYPDEGAQWLGEEDNSEDVQPTWQHIPADRSAALIVEGERTAAIAESILAHAVHAYKVACVARMAMETDPDGSPSIEVLDASIRAGVRAALHAGNGLTTPGVLTAVLAELDRAVLKFPTWPTDPLHAVGVLGEEFGELTKAVMQATYEPHKNGPGAVREEALQTAAMALRFLASLDRYEYAGSVQHHQVTA